MQAGDRAEASSIDNQVADNSCALEMDIEDNFNENNAQYRLEHLNKMTSQLHQDEEILKETLKTKEQQVLQVYEELCCRKKHLLAQIIKEYNLKCVEIDIGLHEEFLELKRVIDQQNKQIEQLRMDISKQGLSGGNYDESFIKIKAKTEEMENAIKVGQKFSSTQYVRDYLERPQAYKVAYEDVKYEYELRLKIKESLEVEKQQYFKKKDELSACKKKERELEQQLLKQRDGLLHK